MSAGSKTSGQGWAGFLKTSRAKQESGKKKKKRKRKRSGAFSVSTETAESHTSKRRKSSKLGSCDTSITLVQCPICGSKMLEHLISFHLEFDKCSERNSNLSSKDSHSDNCSTLKALGNGGFEQRELGDAKTDVRTDAELDGGYVDTGGDHQCVAQLSAAKSMLREKDCDLMDDCVSDKSAEKCKAKKMCLLFTAGALPASAFEKKSGRRRKGPTPHSRLLLFHVHFEVSDSGQYVAAWSHSLRCQKTTANMTPEMEAVIASNKWTLNSFATVKEARGEVVTRVLLSSNIDWNAHCETVQTSDASTGKWQRSSDGAMNGAMNESQSVIEKSVSRSTLASLRKCMRVPPSVCKSLLQKCVRRSLAESAIKAAVLLAKRDSVLALCRRLTVIMAEDCTLSATIIPVTWLTLALSNCSPKKEVLSPFTGFRMTQATLSLLLSAVGECALCLKKDYGVWTGELEGIGSANDGRQCLALADAISDEMAADSSVQTAVVCSLLMRAAFGGMKCDVAMLRDFAVLWKHRFENAAASNLPLAPFSKSPLLLENISALRKCDFALCAVDFHCSAMLNSLLDDAAVVNICAEHLSDGSKEAIGSLLQTVIWEFRSSLTNKQPLVAASAVSKPMELLPLWKAVEPFVNDYSKLYLSSRLRYLL